jgi:signal transduction histidine kinase
MVDSNNLIQSILIVQVVLLLFLLGGLFLINRKLAKRIWEPFNKTLKKLKEYNISHKDPLTLSASATDEFNDLNTSLVELTNRIHIAYQSQKEFAENASHEMQTPLAILQGKLELLMQTEPLSEEQAGLMSDMSDAYQRMVHLNKNLILLTKIDNNLSFVEREKVSLNDTLKTVIHQYQPHLDEKQISLQVQLGNDISLMVNRSLLEILISNMFANAIRHNHAKGSIYLSTQDGDLLLQNSGKEQALDEANIFRRFYKDSADSQSLGLGLEIVKKLCSLYHFNLTYHFTGKLLEFRISFEEHIAQWPGIDELVYRPAYI